MYNPVLIGEAIFNIWYFRATNIIVYTSITIYKCLLSQGLLCLRWLYEFVPRHGEIIRCQWSPPIAGLWRGVAFIVASFDLIQNRFKKHFKVQHFKWPNAAYITVCNRNWYGGDNSAFAIELQYGKQKLTTVHSAKDFLSKWASLLTKLI